MSMSAALNRITLSLHVKQIILDAPGMQLPPKYYEISQSEDTTSWWDFESVEPVLPPDDAHPDLVVNLKDGSQLFIELAINSLVDQEKLEHIQSVGVKTIEIDLRGIHFSNLSMHTEELKYLILHHADIKRWIYPDYMPSTPY
jgi:competence protein CoiA